MPQYDPLGLVRRRMSSMMANSDMKAVSEQAVGRRGSMIAQSPQRRATMVQSLIDSTTRGARGSVVMVGGGIDGLVPAGSGVANGRALPKKRPRNVQCADINAKNGGAHSAAATVPVDSPKGAATQKVAKEDGTYRALHGIPIEEYEVMAAVMWLAMPTWILFQHAVFDRDEESFAYLAGVIPTSLLLSLLISVVYRNFDTREWPSPLFSMAFWLKTTLTFVTIMLSVNLWNGSVPAMAVASLLGMTTKLQIIPYCFLQTERAPPAPKSFPSLDLGLALVVCSLYWTAHLNGWGKLVLGTACVITGAYALVRILFGFAPRYEMFSVLRRATVRRLIPGHIVGSIAFETQLTLLGYATVWEWMWRGDGPSSVHTTTQAWLMQLSPSLGMIALVGLFQYGYYVNYAVMHQCNLLMTQVFRLVHPAAIVALGTFLNGSYDTSWGGKVGITTAYGILTSCRTLWLVNMVSAHLDRQLLRQFACAALATSYVATCVTAGVIYALEESADRVSNTFVTTRMAYAAATVAGSIAYLLYWPLFSRWHDKYRGDVA